MDCPVSHQRHVRWMSRRQLGTRGQPTWSDPMRTEMKERCEHDDVQDCRRCRFGPPASRRHADAGARCLGPQFSARCRRPRVEQHPADRDDGSCESHAAAQGSLIVRPGRGIGAPARTIYDPPSGGSLDRETTARDAISGISLLIRGTALKRHIGPCRPAAEPSWIRPGRAAPRPLRAGAACRPAA